MNTTATLSENAQKLNAHLQKNGGTWIDSLIKVIWPCPTYISNNAEAQKAYWQWEVNLYGNANSRPVCGESVMFEPTDNYSSKVSAAYQELRKAGLADEKNNGFNEYFIFPIRK
jgi:hypothetical protein